MSFKREVHSRFLFYFVVSDPLCIRPFVNQYHISMHIIKTASCGQTWFILWWNTSWMQHLLIVLFWSFNVIISLLALISFTHKVHLSESHSSIMTHCVLWMFKLFLFFVSQVKTAELMINYADKMLPVIF